MLAYVIASNLNKLRHLSLIRQKMLFAYQSKLCEFYIYLGDEIGVVKFIVIANEICKNLRGKSLKFKQTLPQKFKQSLKNPKNSANRPQAHHKKFQWIATNLHACALQILAMTNSLSY